MGRNRSSLGETNAVMTRREGRLDQALRVASGLGAGLGLLMPLLALGLVLAYGFGHLHGALRLFLGYLALAVFALAVPRAIRLGETLRIGELKVSGVVVERSEAPQRFWTWVTWEGLFLAIYLAVAVFLASVSLRSAA